MHVLRVERQSSTPQRNLLTTEVAGNLFARPSFPTSDNKNTCDHARFHTSTWHASNAFKATSMEDPSGPSSSRRERPNPEKPQQIDRGSKPSDRLLNSKGAVTPQQAHHHHLQPRHPLQQRREGKIQITREMTSKTTRNSAFAALISAYLHPVFAFLPLSHVVKALEIDARYLGSGETHTTAAVAVVPGVRVRCHCDQGGETSVFLQQRRDDMVSLGLKLLKAPRINFRLVFPGRSRAFRGPKAYQ